MTLHKKSVLLMQISLLYFKNPRKLEKLDQLANNRSLTEIYLRIPRYRKITENNYGYNGLYAGTLYGLLQYKDKIMPAFKSMKNDILIFKCFGLLIIIIIDCNHAVELTSRRLYSLTFLYKNRVVMLPTIVILP